MEVIMEDNGIGPKRYSRPRFSVSESESCLSNETQYTLIDNGNGTTFAPTHSGFFVQRSTSSTSGGEHAQHLQQCENVIKSHHKLKVYFTVLFVVNVILIIIVIILIMFCVFFLMMARDAENKSSPAGQIEIADYVRKDCPIKCKVLLEQGFSFDKDKECCTFDDVVSKMKTYTDRELVRNLPLGARPRSRSSALSTTGSKPAIHLVGGKPTLESNSNPHFIVGWKSYVKHSVKFDGNDEDDVITVPEKGIYFTYSRIHFTVKQREVEKRADIYQMPVTHALYRRSTGGRFEVIQDSSLKCPMQNDTSVVHSSYLEGIAYYKIGDEIKIGLTYSEKLEYDITNKDNYFGMFKV